MANEPNYLGQSGRIYVPIERLAEGGFGSITRVESDGVSYALKALHVGHGADRNLLRAEAARLQEISSPHVVRYIDYGDQPYPFLVMDLADANLDSYLKQAQARGEHLAPQLVILWADQMFSGLKAIHDASIIHRDLKPENLLIVGDALRVGDFGIARLMGASTATQTFRGWGSLQYMPPEGWAGMDSPRPTPAYDLYSAGVVLYQLATLRLPFEGSVEELRRGHLFDAPTPPRRLRPDLPEQLEALILHLMRKDPAQRCQSSDECLSVLRSGSLLADPIEATPVSQLLTSLRAGAAEMVRRQSAQEAIRAAEAERSRIRDEVVEVAIGRLRGLLDEVAALVRESIAPLPLDDFEESPSDGGLKRNLLIPGGSRFIQVNFGRTSSERFDFPEAPGSVVGFGNLILQDQRGAMAGANVVAFTTEGANWDPRLQLIELSNSPLVMTPMRPYEPFFLSEADLPIHGRRLWGGALHVFQSRVDVLSVENLLRFVMRLVPES